MRQILGRTNRACWFLVIALLIATGPSSDAVVVRASARALPSEKGFQSLGDLLDYISSGWDRLTRSMTDCPTYLDSKISGGQLLFLPANVAAPPGVKEIEKKCSVRTERLP